MTWPTDAHDLLKEDRESYTNSTSRWKRGVNDLISNQYIMRVGGGRLSLSGADGKTSGIRWNMNLLERKCKP